MDVPYSDLAINILTVLCPKTGGYVGELVVGDGAVVNCEVRRLSRSSSWELSEKLFGKQQASNQPTQQQRWDSSSHLLIGGLVTAQTHSAVSRLIPAAGGFARFIRRRDSEFLHAIYSLAIACNLRSLGMNTTPGDWNRTYWQRCRCSPQSCLLLPPGSQPTTGAPTERSPTAKGRDPA